MKATVYNTEIEVLHVNALTAGYGHKKISVVVSYLGKEKTFTATTNNMPAYDEASELEGEEKYQALYEMVESQIEDSILGFIDDVNEENSPYVIVDITSDTGNKFVDENNDLTWSVEFAKWFDTEEEALLYIEEAGWEDWARADKKTNN